MAKRTQALFEIRFNLFDWPEAPERALRDFCFDALFQAIPHRNFPSWLQHEVIPCEGVTERITLAFNVRFQ